MENVKFVKGDTNPTVKSKTEFYELPFDKDRYHFMVLENYVNFIKGCEKIIRTHRAYSVYEAIITSKISQCQILGNVDSSMATLEMHHGPIFTLFDYCGCLITHMIKNNKRINSFIVAKTILKEHFDGNVQTVMLSKTVHQLVDSNKLFISPKQAIGDLNGFLKKYKDGLLEDQVDKINRYIELGRNNKSTDNGLLDLGENIKDWSTRRCY